MSANAKRPISLPATMMWRCGQRAASETIMTIIKTASARCVKSGGRRHPQCFAVTSRQLFCSKLCSKCLCDVFEMWCVWARCESPLLKWGPWWGRSDRRWLRACRAFCERRCPRSSSPTSTRIPKWGAFASAVTPSTGSVGPSIKPLFCSLPFSGFRNFSCLCNATYLIRYNSLIVSNYNYEVVFKYNSLIAIV